MDYDIIILGGGINGAGIARDAAGRGLKVLLCEHNDLASGTSMKSSKLIHGGLRYLEFAEFRLVHEALAEREKLLAIAPHIIWPLTFYLPWVPSLRPRWLIRLGLFLYDHLAFHKKLPKSRAIKFSDFPHNPLKPKFKDGFSYADCWTEDSRLVTLNAVDAKNHGANILTYTECSKVERHVDHWQITLRNKAQQSTTIKGKVLINACGPWVDDVNRDLIKVNTQHHLQKIQGSHLVIKKIFDQDKAFILQLNDKRIIFVLPFEQNFQLIGTTDIAIDVSATQAQTSEAEIAYLIENFNRYFTKSISKKDIIWHFCGVRGLADDDNANPSAVSRDYILEIDTTAAPLLSIFGGKITTYRKLAEHAMEKLTPLLHCSKKSWTATKALPGGENINNFDAFQKQCLNKYHYLAADYVKRLCRYYGNRIDQILMHVRNSNDLGTAFALDLYACEVDYLVQFEFAKTAADILWRRTKIGLYADQQAVAKLETYIPLLPVTVFNSI